MRLYTFINFYLSSIQQGIQTAHILGEFVNIANGSANDFTKLQKEMFFEWCRDHKTIVVCNGGNNKNIRETISLFEDPRNPFPWAHFHEDGESLDSALTGVGIVLPEELYDMQVSFVFDGKDKPRKKIYTYTSEDARGVTVLDDPTTYKYQLVDRIKSAPLAK